MRIVIDEEMIDVDLWVKFKLGDLFTIKTSYDNEFYKKATPISTTKKVPVFRSNCICFPMVSNKKAYYSPTTTCIKVDTALLYLKTGTLTRAIEEYIVLALFSSPNAYTYSILREKDNLKEAVIELKVNQDGTPNYQFMEDVMSNSNKQLAEDISEEFETYYNEQGKLCYLMHF